MTLTAQAFSIEAQKDKREASKETGAEGKVIATLGGMIPPQVGGL